jgi:hypothetical protein
VYRENRRSLDYVNENQLALDDIYTMFRGMTEKIVACDSAFAELRPTMRSAISFQQKDFCYNLYSTGYLSRMQSGDVKQRVQRLLEENLAAPAKLGQWIFGSLGLEESLVLVRITASDVVSSQDYSFLDQSPSDYLKISVDLANLGLMRSSRPLSIWPDYKLLAPDGTLHANPGFQESYVHVCGLTKKWGSGGIPEQAQPHAREVTTGIEFFFPLGEPGSAAEDVAYASGLRKSDVKQSWFMLGNTRFQLQ